MATAQHNNSKPAANHNANPVQPTSHTSGDNTIKNPDDWSTGDEEMTGAQRSYLKTLSDEAGVEMNDELTKAEASKQIDALQHKTGRGLDEA